MADKILSYTALEIDAGVGQALELKQGNDASVTGGILKKANDGGLDQSNISQDVDGKIRISEEIIAEKGIQTIPATLRIGQALEQKAYGGFQVNRDSLNADTHTISYKRFDETGSFANIEVNFRAEERVTGQPDGSVMLTSPSFLPSFSADFDEAINVFYLFTSGDVTDFRFKIDSVATGEPYYYYPDKYSFENGVGIDLIGSGEHTIWLDSTRDPSPQFDVAPTVYFDDINFNVEFRWEGTGNILGNSFDIPKFDVDRQIIDFKAIPAYPEWKEKTYILDEKIWENEALYGCNIAGEQLGDFSSNIALWDKFNISETVLESVTSTANMQFVVDEDDMASDSDTKVPTQQSVKKYVDDMVGSNVILKNGYNADTNTPNLEIAPTGVLLGWMYVVTVNGTFFTKDLHVGDALIAGKDDPTIETDWIILERNLDAATIKVLYESNANTEAFETLEKSNLGLLTTGFDTTLHYHNADRNRVNHTGTQTASTISDFDTEVSNSIDVTLNSQSRVEATIVNGFINPVSDVTCTFTDLTRTLDISPTTTSFTYWSSGERYIKTTSENIVIDDTEGVWFIYYNGSILSKSQVWNNDYILKYALIAVMYWDATNKKQIYFGREYFHGTNMAGRTHEYLHNTRGFTLESGGALTDIDVDASGNDLTSIQFGNEATEAWDEDAFFSFSARNSTVIIPIYYFDGINLRVNESNTYPVINSGSGRASYNEITGSSGSIVEVSNGDFVLAHVFTTNDLDKPYACFMGQNEYPTRGTARDGAEVEIQNLFTIGISLAEIKFLGTLIIETKDSYTNSAKSRFRSTNDGGDYVDLRGSIVGKGSDSIVSSDHNALSNLQGGQVGEYYHLTIAKSTIVDNTSGTNTGDITLSVDDPTQESLDLTNQVLTAVQATITTDGVMIADDKLKLDNISGNGVADHWVSGLAVIEQSPKDQTINYTAGTYLINGILKTVASGGIYDLENGYGSIDHYSGLTVDQHRFVTLYVDGDEVIKSVGGLASDKKEVPNLPTTPVDSVPISLIEIKMDKNTLPKDIKNKEITDTRNAPAFNTDEFVRVSSDDLGVGHLSDKLSNNGNVTFTIENVGGIETLKADASGGSSEYGELYMTATGNQKVSSPEVMLWDTAGVSNGITVSSSTNRITILSSSVHKIEFTGSALAKRNETYNFYIYVNGSEVAELGEVFTSIDNTKIPFGFSRLISLSATDYVEIYGSCTADKDFYMAPGAAFNVVKM